LPAAVIRDDDSRCAMVDRLARVLRGVYTLRDDRTAPRLADPREIFPRDHRLLQRGTDIGIRHRTVREDDVGKAHQAAVEEECGEPAWACEELKKVREHRERRAGQEFLDAIAQVAFTHACHWRVDCDDERGGARILRPFDGCERHVAAAHEIELIPEWAARRCFHIADGAAGERRQGVDRPRFPRRVGGRFFAARKKHTAAADGREDERDIDGVPEDLCAEIAAGGGNGGARTEQHIFENARVLTHGPLGIRAAVDVVEHRTWQPSFRRQTQVGDVQG